MKIFAIIGILMLFVGCDVANKGVYKPIVCAKDNFEVEFLFECEDVRIYRFYDCGHYRYFLIGNKGDGQMTDLANYKEGKYEKFEESNILQKVE